PDLIAERFSPAWDEALRRGHVVTRASEEATELTAPITSGEGVRVAIPVTCSPIPSHRIEESRRALESIAADTAAALERVRVVQRLGYRPRLAAIGAGRTGGAQAA